MRIPVAAFVFVLGCFAHLHAQTGARKGGTTQEIELIAANDILFFEDYYYTAGQDVVYRRLVRPSSRLFKLIRGKKTDSAKVIVTYRAGAKMYNPFEIETPKTSAMDRPYAGWTYGSVAVSDFHKPRAGNYFEMQTGVVGKISGMEQLQLWVHKITDFNPPEGWDSQIRNELVFNFGYTRFQELKLADDADIVSQSSVQAGTGSNKLSQDLTLRLIHFNPLNNSAFTQSRLSWESKDRNKSQEIYFFFGFGVDYVITNVFIEGSVWPHHKSPFTVEATPWVFRRNAGFTYSGRKVSFSIIYYHLTKETPLSTVHDYMDLRLAVRF